MTVSISDMTVPDEKKQILAEAEKTVETDYKEVSDVVLLQRKRDTKMLLRFGKKADDEITKALLTGLDKYNNIFMMADSGARGSNQAD